MWTADTKDWTWVLDRPCDECGYDAQQVALVDLGDRIRDNAAAWRAVLSGPRVHERREAGAWSVTEYAAHVRDVHAVFAERLVLVLEQDAPTFANWDQDATAVEARYDLAQPAAVSLALSERADEVAAAYDRVPASAYDRIGHRSNGSTFTTLTLARYHLHDVVHHLWDVRDDTV